MPRSMGYLPFGDFLRGGTETEEQKNFNPDATIDWGNYLLKQKMAKSCGPTCVQYIVKPSTLSTPMKQQNTFDSPPRSQTNFTEQLTWQDGLTNAQQLKKMLLAEGATAANIVQVEDDWMRFVKRFQEIVQDWFAKTNIGLENLWIVSIEHPNIFGHWIALVPNDRDNGKCKFYDPYTGFEGWIEWGTLHTWFVRDWSEGKNIMASAIQITRKKQSELRIRIPKRKPERKLESLEIPRVHRVHRVPYHKRLKF